jgi:hypothetical protein
MMVCQSTGTYAHKKERATNGTANCATVAFRIQISYVFNGNARVIENFIQLLLIFDDSAACNVFILYFFLQTHACLP